MTSLAPSAERNGEAPQGRDSRRRLITGARRRQTSRRSATWAGAIDRPATMKHVSAMPDHGSRAPGSAGKPRSVRRRRETSPPHALRIKRVYAAPDESDGLRILVDRCGRAASPRKRRGSICGSRDAAPSNELRRQFHRPSRPLGGVQRRLRQGVGAAAAAGRRVDHRQARRRRVTLLYAARDERRNNAVALRAWLVARMGA